MSDAPTALLILAIGLVLGAVCYYVYACLRAMTARIDDSDHLARSARDAATDAKSLGDKLNTHDHEIAVLFDRAGIRRK